MKTLVAIKADVTKFDKSRFYRGKDGAIYVDLSCWVDFDNEGRFGDHGFITQSVSKEEREQGLKLPIVGNIKVLVQPDRNESPTPQNNVQQIQQAPQEDFGDIPF